MYRVLYRKWRPQTFDDVSGQPHITHTLQNEVRENRLAHAYLFTGSRGTGKTSCAKILSKAINCLNPINGNPCNSCDICKGIDSGSLLDVVEIDAASNRGIDDIRALREESSFTPVMAKYRVYIIDEVHMLTIEAFNALLKTLEEPAEHVVFILATTDVQKLPPTILSRCQRFDFKRISVSAIAERLKYVAKEENVNLTDDAAILISRIADGGMRDALSIFDRALSISENVDVNVVTDAAGMISNSYLFELSKAFKNKDTSAALEIINEIHSSSVDSERLCSELTNHFRNILIVKSVNKPEDILASTDEEITNLRAFADVFTTDEILHIMGVLSNTIAAIKSTQNRRIETEIAMIKICSPDVSQDISSLLARISSLEERIKGLESGNKIAFSLKNPAPAAKEVITPIKPQETPKNPLDSLVFEDDSDEYEDDIPFDVDDAPSQENNIVFDEIPQEATADAPIFDELPTMPSGDDMPIFDELPTQDSGDGFTQFDDAPVFDDEPVFDAPVFDSQPVSEDASSLSPQMWNKCIIAAENACHMIIGHLVNTTATLNGNTILVSNYHPLLHGLIQIAQKDIDEACSKVLGKPVQIKLA